MTGNFVFKGKIDHFGQTNPLFVSSLSQDKLFASTQMSVAEEKCGPILHSSAVQGGWTRIPLEGSPFFDNAELLIDATLIDELSQSAQVRDFQKKFEEAIVTSLNSAWAGQNPKPSIKAAQRSLPSGSEDVVICSDFVCGKDGQPNRTLKRIRVLQPAQNFGNHVSREGS